MDGFRLVICSGMALALVAGAAVAGAASGSTRALPPLISKNLAPIGTDVTKPRGPYQARPSKVIFATYGDPAAYVDHLHWFDWGKPVAYARAIVHTRAWQQHGYVATPGGVIVEQLVSCNGRSYYTSAQLFAPAGFAVNSRATGTGLGLQALTPC
jgi:hypothetical protein